MEISGGVGRVEVVVGWGVVEVVVVVDVVVVGCVVVVVMVDVVGSVDGVVDSSGVDVVVLVVDSVTVTGMYCSVRVSISKPIGDARLAGIGISVVVLVVVLVDKFWKMWLISGMDTKFLGVS